MGSWLSTWLSGTKSVYIGNASSVRDYRVQLRGSRSVILFGLYLIILIGIAMFVYSQTADRTGFTLVQAQFQLRQFTSTIMILLGFAVAIVAPGLTATSVVTERQRQSLDLIFSAPVSPKYYLVGKVMSSFRYTWMLLVLALPITAASVVLGGASWSDVLIAYVLMSLFGLVLTSFALLMSTLASKPVSAIIWSYVGAFVYSGFTFLLSTSYTLGRMFGASRDNEASWWVSMSPFSVLDTSHTYTQVGSLHVPNWIFVLAFTLLASKILLLGAGSVLGTSGGKEIKGLRIYALIYIATFALLPSWNARPAFTPVSSASTTAVTAPIAPVEESLRFAQEQGQYLALCTAPLLIFVPFIACFGFDREKRYWPNGVFKLKNIVDGTPAGGLPFLLAVIGTLVVAWNVGCWFGAKSALRAPFWEFAFYVTAFWTFFWALGRLISSFFAGLKTSRMMVFALFVLLVVIPYPFLVALVGTFTDDANPGPWNLYVMSPFMSTSDLSRADIALAYGLVLAAMAAVMAVIAEKRIRSKMVALRNYDVQPN